MKSLKGREFQQIVQHLTRIAALLLLSAHVTAAKTMTVAADGSGDFTTMQNALAAVPDNSAERTILHIKPGTYQGQMILPKEKRNVSFEGEDALKTILTFGYNTNEVNPPAVNPRFKGTGVVILANDFRADKITFENTSGDHGQALALRVDGDRAVITNCRLLGWQDTLMLNNARQYLKDCYIEGRVDFIYGSGTVVFDNCRIHSKNGGFITAANTPQEKPYGFVFLQCRLTGDPNPWVDPATGQPPAGSRADAQTYLGRPWRPYGNVAFLNCQMGDHIRPAGWNNWDNAENEKTARYAEYNSRTLDETRPGGTVVTGQPVDVSRRVPWAKQLTAEEAAPYTLTNILGGWNPASLAGN